MLLFEINIVFACLRENYSGTSNVWFELGQLGWCNRIDAELPWWNANGVRRNIQNGRYSWNRLILYIDNDIYQAFLFEHVWSQLEHGGEYIGVGKAKYTNTSRSSDVIWWHKPCSASVYVMALRLLATMFILNKFIKQSYYYWILGKKFQSH